MKKHFYHVLFCTVLSAAFVVSSATVAPSDITGYFGKLKHNFDRIASHPVVHSKNLKALDSYYGQIMEQVPQAHSILVSDIEGDVISEIQRGETPRHASRNVGLNHWFSMVKSTEEEYMDFVKTPDGLYYLLWSKPLFTNGEQSEKQLIGALAMQIDLWDCFDEFSSGAQSPFLIAINGRSWYSHEWKSVKPFEKQSFSIPGITVCELYRDIDPTVAAADTRGGAGIHNGEGAMPFKDGVTVASIFATVQNIPSKYLTLVGIYALILLVILFFVVFKITVWIKHKFLLRSVEKTLSY
jgi:hypothetical protein